MIWMFGVVQSTDSILHNFFSLLLTNLWVLLLILWLFNSLESVNVLLLRPLLQSFDPHLGFWLLLLSFLDQFLGLYKIGHLLFFVDLEDVIHVEWFLWSLWGWPVLCKLFGLERALLLLLFKLDFVFGFALLAHGFVLANVVELVEAVHVPDVLALVVLLLLILLTLSDQPFSSQLALAAQVVSQNPFSLDCVLNGVNVGIQAKLLNWVWNVSNLTAVPLQALLVDLRSECTFPQLLLFLWFFFSFPPNFFIIQKQIKIFLDGPYS